MKDVPALDGLGENKSVLSILAKHNCAGRIVSADHVEDLKKNIQGLARRGAVNHEFYQERLTFFDFNVPEDAKSVIIVAAPRPRAKPFSTCVGGEPHSSFRPRMWRTREQ